MKSWNDNEPSERAGLYAQRSNYYATVRQIVDVVCMNQLIHVTPYNPTTHTVQYVYFLNRYFKQQQEEQQIIFARTKKGQRHWFNDSPGV